MKHRATIPLFIPEMACPHRCVFCNQHSITGQMAAPTLTEVKQTIEKYLVTLKGIPHIEAGFFGGSFTGIPLAQQLAYLKVVEPYINEGKIHSIRLSTRPDYIDVEILDMLKENHVTTVELGAQSLDDQVLLLAGRGHTAKDVADAAALIRSYGFDLGLQMMIGLPGDTPEKTLNTAKQIVALGAHNTRIYPTLVVKDTELARLWQAGKYRALTIEEAVEATVEPYLIFERAGLEIIRVGLHPAEGFLNGEDLLAGPFHVSFRELVLTKIYERSFQSLIKSSKSRNITIHIPASAINHAVGYKSNNRKMLEEKFEKVNFRIMKELKYTI